MARHYERKWCGGASRFVGASRRAIVLLAATVTAVAGLAVRKMMIHPRVQRPLGQRFLQIANLGEIEAAYVSERGRPPFDPAMMTALLLCGYCNGVSSSRRIAKATRERVDFLSIVGLDPPDFRTVSDFHSGT